MLKNYFKIAWRNLVKNKVYSAINIVGLAAGMAVAMLIGLWISDEVTYDNYHTNHKELAQLMTVFVDNDGTRSASAAVAMPAGEELRSKYGSDFKNISMASWNFGHVLGVGNKKITGQGMWVEHNFPSMLSLKMIKGNINALNDPSSVLISASIAKSLFGDADAINKTIRFDNKNDFKVAGVFEDLPHNTTLYDAKLFLPWKKYITTEDWLKRAATQWNNHSWQCFVQLNDNVDVAKLTAKIKNVVMVHKNAATDGVEEAFIHPMDKWHLYSDFKNGEATSGRIQFVWLFAVIGVFVLLLACINFMNLSTARSEKRAKEVGIRKTVGSVKSQLISQFLSESVLVAFLSFALAILLVIVLLPMFNKLADKSISIPWSNGAFWLLATAFTLLTGLIAGSYPALYLSKFEPIKVLKGTFRVGKYASLPRKVLVVVQFTFSIALIIGTIIVYKQILFAQNRPVNYDKAGLITIPMTTPDLYGHYDALRSDLIATGAVENMAESSSPTTAVYANQIGFNWQGKDPNTLPSFGTIGVTVDFGKTIGWQIKEGRDFSKDFATDSLGMILNEAAVKQINMKRDIVGQTIQFNDRNYTVVGVIKDMVMESPYQPVTPTVFTYDPNWANVISIKMKPGVGVKDALGKIEAVFKKYNPSSPFDYSFNDEEYAKKFADEQRVGRLATFFTILAIFISCLGLFGLASFVAEQRKKEIGVRKVLGASVFNLWQMLSKEFALLVGISCLVAIPLAWYYLNGWLKHYNYKTDISWWIFVVSCVGALMVTLITVSFQAIKAAIANPVKSLRTE
ncbi:ABC transporter permease [Parafilimonas terrae]|uniref:ABC-type antimicrobial peptide transport system, permease component n=1 Tax=Parafilimonas terrae TaxID=1465490 RepID=A0A1I5S451_9BACT|nr:ABC transporter permease [Parafilimonas terrae]SFP65515.1 ABC-type antimicrobial peptide transport system, permease component [Parafilimonas terrae]